MRLAAVTDPAAPDQAPALGVADDTVVSIPERTATLLELLRSGEGAVSEYAEAARRSPARRVELAQARFHAPLPDPPTVRDFMTFEGHTVGGLGRGDASAVAPAWWEIPAFYFTNPYAIRGPFDDVPMAPGTERFDFELEVAAVVGRTGENLTVAQAEQHLAGYLIFVDWSARDVQMHEMSIGLGPAKGKDTASTLGPFFVTADEIAERRVGDRIDLPLSVAVNGASFGASNLRDMAWSFAEITAYASRGTWVRPGDLLGSGTCDNGCLAELWGRQGPDAAPPLRPGDVVEIDADLLGITRNAIVDAAPFHPIPSGRTAPGRQEDS